MGRNVYYLDVLGQQVSRSGEDGWRFIKRLAVLWFVLLLLVGFINADAQNVLKLRNQEVVELKMEVSDLQSRVVQLQTECVRPK